MSRNWIFAGLASLSFIVLSLFLVDRPVARLMTGVPPDMLAVFRFITWFGQGGVVLYPTGVLVLAALLLKPRLPSLADELSRVVELAGALFVTVAAAGLANDALKIIFGRARPYLWLKGDTSGFDFFRYGAKFASFPSGHTATSVAAAITLGVLFPRFRLVFAALALLIAVSRVVLDAHYVSDVIGGASVGAAVAILILGGLRRRGWLRARPAGFLSP